MVQGVVGVWNSEPEFFGHVRLRPFAPAVGSLCAREVLRARLCRSDLFCCKGSLAFAQASNKKGLLSSPGSFRVDLFTSPLSLT